MKRTVKSPILHNTRDGAEFKVLTLHTICNFRGGLGLRVGWEEGEGEEESQGSIPVYYKACLKT